VPGAACALVGEHAADVSPNVIATAESGKRDLRLSTARKLLKAMKVAVLFRVGGTEIS
jgi:predicted transcriptional regulator